MVAYERCSQPVAVRLFLINKKQINKNNAWSQGSIHEYLEMEGCSGFSGIATDVVAFTEGRSVAQ